MSRPAEITLRDYEDADGSACAAVYDAAWHAGHPYAPRIIGLEQFVGDTADEQVIVAEDGVGRVLGFVAVYEADAFVHHLYVDPDAKGCRVGTRLLHAAISALGRQASLKCQTRNTAALAFYRHLGWSDGDGGVSDGEPWIRMISPPLPHGVSGLSSEP